MHLLLSRTQIKAGASLQDQAGGEEEEEEEDVTVVVVVVRVNVKVGEVSMGVQGKIINKGCRNFLKFGFGIPARIGMCAPADKPLLSLAPYLDLQRPAGTPGAPCSP